MGKRAPLEEERVGRLGLLDDEGGPRVLPVTFAVTEGRIWSAIDRKPKRPDEPARLRFLRRDPGAALTVDRDSDDWDELAWVQVLGRVADPRAPRTVGPGSRRSARSTGNTGRRRRRGPCSPWSRGDTFRGELWIGRAEVGVATSTASDQDLVARGIR